MGKILVTGGAGYIGSHAVKALGESGFEVIIIDNLSTGFKESILYGELYQGDLKDREFVESVFKRNQIDAVLHFAGSIIVPESVEKPHLYYQNNTENSRALIETCLKFKVKRFIFSSTAAVYGMGEGRALVESDLTSPINPYGRSKLMTEWMLEDTAKAHDFNYIALRYFNVAGADFDGKLGQKNPGATHLIKVSLQAACGKRDSMSIFGTDYETEDGTGVRDYIHVVDLANAHVEALKYLMKNSQSHVMNCGYGRGFSVREVVEVCKQVTGVDFKVIDGPRRAGDPDLLISNPGKIREVLGWKPKHDDLKRIVESAWGWERKVN